MPRPTSLTPAVQARIVKALRDGNSRKVAATFGGVAASTFYEWMKTFPVFSDAVEQAEDEAERRMVASIAKAATGFKTTKTKTTVGPNGLATTESVVTNSFAWQAALEWLKRRRKAEWGDKPDETEGGDALSLIRALLATMDGGKPAPTVLGETHGDL